MSLSGKVPDFLDANFMSCFIKCLAILGVVLSNSLYAGSSAEQNQAEAHCRKLALEALEVSYRGMGEHGPLTGQDRVSSEVAYLASFNACMEGSGHAVIKPADNLVVRSNTELSRSEAERMIVEYKKFPIPFGLYLETQRDIQIYNDPRWPYLALEKQGLIKHGAPFQFSGTVVYKIDLTEKGELFRVASDSGFVKVTGIAPMEFGFKGARVEYEWTYDNKTPFHALIVQGPGYLQAERPCLDQFGNLYSSSVMFRLYDDGWRIAN